MIPDNKLDFWIKNNLNVILRGRHGTGKSSVILDAFQRHNLKYKYFSASTMDPWVDFIGVPKEKKDGDSTYLELIRPKEFQDDSIEAIFFDEFSRSSKKIRNAVMELIQFKSINGKKFNNLKMIWAAINPEKDDSDPDSNLDYDVEKLDPAQLDRFHIIYDVPYKLDKSYFTSKYGGVISESIGIWWNKLPKDIKESLSPRRMDYLIDIFNKKGDIKDVIGKAKVNVSELIKILESQTCWDLYNTIWREKDEVKAKAFLADMNNIDFFIESILKKTGVGDHTFYNFWLPNMQTEKLTSLVFDSKHGLAIQGWIFDKSVILKHEFIQNLIMDWYISKFNTSLTQKSAEIIEKYIDLFVDNEFKKKVKTLIEKNKKQNEIFDKTSISSWKSKYPMLGDTGPLTSISQLEFKAARYQSNTYTKAKHLNNVIDSVLKFKPTLKEVRTEVLNSMIYMMDTFQVSTTTRAGDPSNQSSPKFGARFLSYVLYSLEINPEYNKEAFGKLQKYFIKITQVCNSDVNIRHVLSTNTYVNEIFALYKLYNPTKKTEAIPFYSY